MAAEDTPIGALTQRLAAGNEAAFAAFYELYGSRLFRYILVLQRGDEHAASDVFQNTLIRVVRHARRFDDEAALWDWLARLARNAAADHGRKSSRYLRFLDRFRQSSLEVEESNHSNLTAAIDAALLQLPPQDAQLLQAKYHDQKSQRDLAAQLGISEEAAESRLRRARSALKQLAFQILNQQQS